MRGNYQWWDNLVGSLMPGHAATGNTTPACPRRSSSRTTPPVHRSTGSPRPAGLRNDEWYNFSTNVRGNAHVLLSMDETTYDPGGNPMGYDHPIAWCKPYDGGRAWVTGWATSARTTPSPRCSPTSSAASSRPPASSPATAAAR